MKEETKKRIEALMESHPVLLFMKGDKMFPQCGFSARAVAILNELGADFETFNILEDEGVRAGIKEYGNWPTIPQLYIKKELIGGSDILLEMFHSGELKELLPN